MYGYTYKIKLTTFTGIGGTNLFDPCEDTICFGDGTRAVVLRSNGPIGICGGGVKDGVPINPSMKLNEYVTNHTYPGPGNYIICFNELNRNPGVNNIPNSVNQNFSLESLLVIPTFGSGKNSCPVFANIPLAYDCLNNSCFNYNPSALDSEGDSLSYEVLTCLNPGSSYPLSGTSGTFSINPISGLLSWCNPQTIGDNNVIIKITEWRNDGAGDYFVVGYVIRDTQFAISACAGLNEFNDITTVTISPNPFSNYIKVEFNQNINEQYRFELFDITGRKIEGIKLISNQNHVFLKLEELIKGIYFLKVTGNNGTTITKKIIKD